MLTASSQWTTMLDRIGDMLEEAKIKFARLDGTMTREERAKAVEALRINKRVEVLLVSTRAGGVGLNLTAASRCFLIDPYWCVSSLFSPPIDAQEPFRRGSSDRSYRGYPAPVPLLLADCQHRMGQTRPVTAIKLMINNSIERKLDEIQRKKANLAQMSLNHMTRKELMAKKVRCVILFSLR